MDLELDTGEFIFRIRKLIRTYPEDFKIPIIVILEFKYEFKICQLRSRTFRTFRSTTEILNEKFIDNLVQLNSTSLSLANTNVRLCRRNSAQLKASQQVLLKDLMGVQIRFLFWRANLTG